MLLIKSQYLDEPLDFSELMRYSLTPVPHSLGTADGFFNKTNKAAMLHFLMEDTPEEVPYPKDALYIQDGNALFHALTNLPQRLVQYAFSCLIRWWLRKTLYSQRIHIMLIPSRPRRDCAVASLSGTSSRGQQQESPANSSYSWQTRTTRSSYVNFYYGCGEAKLRHHGLRKAGQPWQWWMARHTSWTRQMAMYVYCNVCDAHVRMFQQMPST
jgi:hypothetical protein